MESSAARSATYRLVVGGELDGRFAYFFNGMRMERIEGTTVLTGRAIDQAQLHGLIVRFGELGLELLDVEQLAESSCATRSACAES
jgi:hypothetical protein